jgi:protein ImuB
MDGPVRTLVVWCPDWPVLAAIRSGEVVDDFDGTLAVHRPVAVMRANRVVATSASARAGGIRRGMRRREAQSRVGSVELVSDDATRDARWFEPIVAAIDRFTPLIEIVRAGLCQFATRGPSRYFGGDEALVEQIHAAVSALGVGARLGIADGPFAAALAARSHAAVEAGHLIVGVGHSADFLADHPISALIAAGAERMGDGRAHRRAGRAGARPSDGFQRADGPQRADGAPSSGVQSGDVIELVDLLNRLGLSTLGSVAAIDRSDMLARFGLTGVAAHRLCSGDDEAQLEPTPIPPDLSATIELDPPIDRVEAAAFVAKGLAEELHDRLGHRGLACTRVRIEARTDTGVDIVRLWRHERAGAAGGLTAQGLADRVRWQLDGWLRRLADEARTVHLDNQRADDIPDSEVDPTAEWSGRGRCILIGGVNLACGETRVMPTTEQPGSSLACRACLALMR